MQQLTALDSQFLGLETPECPMNMGLLIMLQGPVSEAAFAQLLASLKAGALRVERHHQRLWRSAFRHDHPYWLNDGSLRTDLQVQHHQLAAPGSIDQLHALTEKLLMRPLDRSQPLWEFHLIHGLQDGRQALISKMHHACADGLNALKMFAQAVENPDNLEAPQPAIEQAGAGQRVLALGRLLKSPFRLVYNYLAEVVLRLYLLSPGLRQRRQRPPQSTRFIGPIGRRRSYATADFPLSAFRKINRQYSASQNEVLMTLYSGALRRYLGDKNELPARSLHAGMPVSMIFSHERQQASNQAGLIRVTLGTRIADPVARLATMKVRCERALAKKPSKLWRRLETLWMLSSPEVFALLARAYRRLLELGRICPTTSAITTYMPGPSRPVTIGAFKIQAIYPLSIIYHGCGLSISAMRYAGNIHVGVVADRNMLPDPQVFAGLLQDEFEQLMRQADKPS